jgi:uncharacterized membrane protein YvbJ
MGLLKCPDCGHQHSDRASSCPQCGRPVQGKRTEQITGIDTFVVLGSCLLGLVLVGIFSFLGPAALILIVVPPIVALVYTSRRKL